MKRTILSLLVVGLFAGVGTSAIAQNVPAEDQPAAKNEQTMAPETDAKASKPAISTEKDSTAQSSQQDSSGKTPEQAAAGKADGAAKSTAKADTTAQDKAQAQYKVAKAKCDSQQDDAKRLCLTEDTKARTEALAKAKTQSESQGESAVAPSDTAKDNAADSGAKPADDKVSEAPEQPQYPKQE